MRISNLCLEYKYRINDQVRKRGETYKGKGEYFWRGYADDLVIPTDNQEKMQHAANILSELLLAFISIDKTKTMILNFKGDTYPDHLIMKGKSQGRIQVLCFLRQILRSKMFERQFAKQIDVRIYRWGSIDDLISSFPSDLDLRIRS